MSVVECPTLFSPAVSYFLRAPDFASFRDHPAQYIYVLNAVSLYQMSIPAHLLSNLRLTVGGSFRPDPDMSLATAGRLEVKNYTRSYTFTPMPSTNAGSSATGPISAPIQRLPPEILSHIFSLHSDAFTPAFRTPFPILRSYEFEAELDRLANIHLLTLSRVCGQWHHIVVDTPALWSTFNLNGVLWSSSYYLEQTMVLLAAGLERSRNAPIEVRVFDQQLGLPLPPRIFELLAHHSHRWRVAEFCCIVRSIDFSILKGRLPVVQRLELDLGPVHPTLDFFVGAPRLKSLIVPGVLLGKTGTIPFKQLTALGCERVAPVDIARAISLADELPRGSHFHLSAQVAKTTQSFPVCIPLTMSAISRFSCRLAGDPYPRRSCQGLGKIFASLSLPNLEELWLSSNGIVSEWPHAQFCELSERSGFHRSLKVLRIVEVLVTEGDLLSVLSSLTSLEHLEIADVDHGGVKLVVLTDDFLRAVTFQADRRLVPRLRHFACTTQFQFTDNAFVEFIASRLAGCSLGAFRVEIRPLPGCQKLPPRSALSRLLYELGLHSKTRLRYNLAQFEELRA
ncbi:hypothetical protein B0H19DRAFT_294524 [Mycena capillaripes]|nr:hypothetical protein B0H19DRAFT_294524 [Mycena capillaripes]